MKRIVSLLALVLFFASVCMAQVGADSAKIQSSPRSVNTIKDKKRFSFGVNLGYGIPIGSFYKKDASKYPISHYNGQDTNKLGGYGQYGFHFEYYVSYRFYKRLSIMLSAGGNDIGYDITTLNSQFGQFFAPNTLIMTTGDSDYVVQFLMGPNLDLRIGKKIRLEFKALAGMTTTNFPSLAITGFANLGQVGGEVYTFPTASGFGYNIGAGLKIITAEGYVGVHFNINYVGANLTFPNYNVAYYTLSGPNNATSATYLGSTTFPYAKSLDISMLQLSMGVSAEL